VTTASIEMEQVMLEQAVLVAEWAFDDKRARLERGYAESQGWTLPLKARQYRAMNRMIDGMMMESSEGRELARASKALRDSRFKVARMRAGYLA